MLGTTEIKNKLIQKYEDDNFVLDKSGCRMVEIMNCNFIADKPYILRKPNLDYIRKELDWYISQSLNVNDIEKPIPKIWKQIASCDGYINSNYGYMIFSKDNCSQYENALTTMINDIHTRRCIMIYTRPSMQYDYNEDGMSDFTCTNSVQYLYRDGKIHSIVNMRSNDAIFGYNNDYAWQEWVLNKFIKDIQENFTAKIEKGNIYWNAASLHVYEHHFNLLGENCDS